MKCNTIIATSALLVTLAACGTPTEQCEARVASEQRNVRALLAEVEGNIARGYAWETQPVRDTGLRFCAGGYRGGNFGLGLSSCYGGTNTMRERVPIDPVAETRKRDALQQRLTALSTFGQSQCVARYGAATPQR
ncbi:hypothetical protein [Paracoccus shanxieyensis]|uniref:Excinuclease ABC subunit B n=1 Tax=Paracoccus shanxieyensis TaxID=2675752 RepID=A0A6L6IYI7_9RHOB|nr:hypothetical protein [Paracoccus shanxieyensis]MTH64150.1 hypothetical protein [Paracoccus shanxieyensis]MTH87294.1 hypothetical protein [Paracoccus shanxieyensis]